MLSVEKFDPPAEFRANATWSDPKVYEEAAADPEAWWTAQAKELLDWDVEPSQGLDDSNPPFYKWFADGRLNASAQCLDRHVEAGIGDRVAYHWRGEEGEERDVTYADLHRVVQRFANALKDLGVRKGDVVGIYLPMIPEVVVAMLACARIGAIHNVVFGGFSAESVAERMDFSEAKALVTVDGARRKGKTAPIKPEVDIHMANHHALETIVVIRHTGIECPMSEGRDVFYDEVLAAADPECPAEPMEAEHPLYILYTSGSTAKPKGILHTTGGYMTGVTATHRYVFDLKPESDVYWCAADVGWVTGHSYIVYGPLSNGATSVMWEGAPDHPHKGIWWELVERYKATILYAAPTAIRTFIKWGADIPAEHDLSSLRLLGSVGEPINPKAWLWYHKVIGGGRCPIVDTWWQTETGAIMISPLPGITATKPGSATTPFPGVEAQVIDESEGKPIEEGQGLLVLERPWPSMLRGLYKEDDRFIETYFSRFGKDRYLVGDAARRDSDGYFWVIGRIDDVVNVSGHRLSTAEVESAIVAHPDVAEAAVIGESDEQTGQAICAFVTVRGEIAESDELVEGIRATVAERIGKFARPKRIVWADDLPKTRSGKIMRRLLRDIAEGRAMGDVTTLRDPEVMKELESKIAEEQAKGD
jgi:acetyl-CoA synthetase